MPKGKGYSYGKGMGGRSNSSMRMSYEGHMGSGKKIMGHATKTYDVDVFKAQKRDIGRMDPLPMGYRGSPDQAFDYNY